MNWVKNGQKVTSLGDLYEYPKGMLNFTIMSFVAVHILSCSGVVVLIAVVVRLILKKRQRSRSENGCGCRKSNKQGEMELPAARSTGVTQKLQKIEEMQMVVYQKPRSFRAEII